MDFTLQLVHSIEDIVEKQATLYLLVSPTVWASVDCNELSQRNDVVFIGRLESEALALIELIETTAVQRRQKSKRVRCCVCPARIKSVDFGAHFARFHGLIPRSCRHKCPVCDEIVSNVAEHAVHRHAAGARPQSAVGALFSLVLCRHRTRRDEFLLTLEGGGEGWWVPGGHVDAGESFQTAALRETAEEAGAHAATLLSIVNFEHFPYHNKIRVIFYAESDEEELKMVPDFESQGARWVKVEEMSRLHWRSAYEYERYLLPLYQDKLQLYPLASLKE